MNKQKICGQAAVEYVLLIAVVSLSFGLMFTAIRQNLYRLWVCDMAPRIQSPDGCRNNTNQCWQAIGSPPAQYCSP